jgi:hypothetical protein
MIMALKDTAIRTESITIERNPITGETPTKVVSLITIIVERGVGYTFTMSAIQHFQIMFQPLDIFSSLLTDRLYNN